MTSSSELHNIGDGPTQESGPASTGQRLLWVLERSRAQGGTLNVPVVVRLRSNLNKSAMENAVKALVARHESLRTRMQWKPPRLRRVVAPNWRPEIRMIDLSSSMDPMTAFRREIRAELTTDMLSTDWPIRTTVWTLAPDDHVVCVNLNHMTTDSGSNEIILRELALLYRAECGEVVQPLPEIGWQYSQWVEWETSQLGGSRRARFIDYWDRQLAGAVSPRFSPSRKPEDSKASTGFESWPLGVDVFQGMLRVAEKERAPLFSLVLAILYIAIYRQTGQTDLTVTTLLSARNRPQLLSTVGYFVSAVPLRTGFNLSDSFVALLHACRTTLLGAMQHQTMPFHALPRTVTRKTNIDIDGVVVQMMGDLTEFPEPFEPWWRGRPDFNGGRTFDLEVVVWSIRGSWQVNVLYTTHRFEAQFIRNLIAGFCAVAEMAVADPLLLIRDLAKNDSDDRRTD